MAIIPFQQTHAQCLRVCLLICLAAPVLIGGGALAQDKAPVGKNPVGLDNENGRYAFYETAGNVLRLDTRTGKVSTCRKSDDTGWACYAVADDRAALEEEIARLQSENARLKSALLAHNVPLPGKEAQAPKTENDFSLRIEGPGIARMKAALNMAWSRLIELVDELRKEMKPNG